LYSSRIFPTPLPDPLIVQLDILLERTHKLSLLLWSLVCSVTKLRRGVNPFEIHFLQRFSGGMDEHGFSESHDTFLDTRGRTFEEKEVILNLTVADESTHGSDLFLGSVELGGGVVGISTFADAVDLVVDRGTVVVSILTSTSDGPLNVRWMPGTDTSNLSKTLVCLSRKFLGAPSAGNTLETVAFGYSDDINHLVLLEDGADPNRLLEKAASEVNLVGNATSVNLDLHQMGFLLLEGSDADLGVGEDTDDGAVLLDALKFTGDG